MKLLKKIFRKKEKTLEVNIPTIEDNYEVIIHIGAPKTGTSTLQKFFLENQKDLQKEGFYYPNHGLDKNGISGGHSNFGLAILKNELEVAKEIFEAHLNEAKKRNSKLLLSAESLFNQHQKLKEIVNQYRCKIIAFHRDPIESIFSSYNQGIKRHFQTIDINTMCKDILNQNSAIPPERIFEEWCEVFNKKNITIIEYDMNYFKKVSIQETFLRFLNTSEKTISKIKPKNFLKINKSYNIAELELKRLLNHILDKENEKLNDQLDWLLQELSDKRNENLKLFDTMSQDIKNKLYIKYKNTKKEMISLGMICLNSSENMERIDSSKIYTNKNKIIEIFSIIKYIEVNHYSIYKYLVNCIKLKLVNNINLSIELQTIAQWFDISYTNIERNVWFNQNQVNDMVDGKYQEADFLRDIAIILKDRGDIVNAKKIINKAFELRSNGPFIKKFKEDMENK